MITHSPLLDSLYLYKNNFTGPLPECLGDLTNVVSLDVSHNRQLGGSIPDSIGKMYSVQRLHLAYTDLTGEIPSTMADLHRLESFVANNNKLNGTLPDMSKLDQLSKCKSTYSCSPLHSSQNY